MWPFREGFFEYANDNLGVGFRRNAADLEAEDIVEGINRAEVLEPVELVRGKTFER